MCSNSKLVELSECLLKKHIIIWVGDQHKVSVKCVCVCVCLTSAGLGMVRGRPGAGHSLCWAFRHPHHIDLQCYRGRMAGECWTDLVTHRAWCTDQWHLLDSLGLQSGDCTMGQWVDQFHVLFCGRAPHPTPPPPPPSSPHYPLIRNKQKLLRPRVHNAEMYNTE